MKLSKGMLVLAIIYAALSTTLAILCHSCTENQKAKQYGGTATIELPKGVKLVNCTWKDSDLWYLTRPMTASDSAVTYEFKEESNYGIWEGTYVIKETK